MGFFARHAECRADAIHVGIKLWERIALAGVFSSRTALSGPQIARLHAAQLLSVIEKIPAVPELPVADAVDPDLDLLLDDFGHLPGQDGGVVAVRGLGGAGAACRNRRQFAGMGRSDR